MKRLITTLMALLMILCLPLTALAEDAPAHVTEQLSSNTGHTTITIDADVIVPEAQAIPRYQVRLREFTEAEVYAMADALFGKKPYETLYEDDWYMLMGTQEQIDTGVATVDNGRGPESTLSVGSYFWGNNLSSVYADFLHASVEGEGHFELPVWLNAIPEGPLSGCEISLEGARAQADAAVAAFAPQMTCVAEGTTWAETYAFHQGGTIPRHHQGWVFCYTRALPLPITYERTSPSNDFGEEVCQELITVVVDDDGIQAVRYDMPFEITQTLDENCALLSFDQIVNVARTIFPLRYAYSESEYKDTRLCVDQITLGYMVVLSRNNSDYCEIIPVWDFFGTAEYRREKNGEVVVAWDEPYQSLLTISAIDGTIIDREYGY